MVVTKSLRKSSEARFVKMSSGVAEAYMHGSKFCQSKVARSSLPAQVHRHSSFQGEREKEWEKKKRGTEKDQESQTKGRVHEKKNGKAIGEK